MLSTLRPVCIFNEEGREVEEVVEGDGKEEETHEKENHREKLLRRKACGMEKLRQ